MLSAMQKRIVGSAATALVVASTAQAAGLNSGDIKPYPFGTSLKVSPTLLRTPGEDGSPRVHIVVEAGRTSVVQFLATDSPSDQVTFQKLNVTSEAVLSLGQTLILSGLNQRESISGGSGVPVRRWERRPRWTSGPTRRSTASGTSSTSTT